MDSDVGRLLIGSVFAICHTGAAESKDDHEPDFCSWLILESCRPGFRISLHLFFLGTYVYFMKNADVGSTVEIANRC